jgi:hypothetical protein
MKILAKFHGQVIKFNSPPTPSYVTLKDLDTNKVVQTDAISENLIKQSIDYDGCEFEVVVRESLDGKIETEMYKINPNQLELGL